MKLTDIKLTELLFRNIRRGIYIHHVQRDYTEQVSKRLMHETNMEN